MKILKNNIYILKHVAKAVPFYIPAMVLHSIIQALVTVGELLITKLVVNDLIGTELSFHYILVYYLVYILLDYLCTHIKIVLENVLKSVKVIHLSQYMRNLLYTKLKELDIYCFESYAFYNDYERVIQEIDSRPVNVVDSIAQFLDNFITVFLITVIIFEPVFILMGVLIVIKHLIYMNKINKVNYDLFVMGSPIDRKTEYIKNLFRYREFIKEAKIFRTEDFFVEMNDFYMDEEYKISKKQYYKSFVATIITMLIGSAAEFVMAVYVGYQVIMTKFLAGDLLYLLNAFSVFANHMTSLFEIIPELKKHSMYIEQIRKVLEYEPDIPEYAEGIEPKKGLADLAAHAISFQYPGTDFFVLENVSFDIKSGDKVALVGENGCGKSTLIKLILYFYRTNQGEISLNQIPYSKYNAASLRSSFGVLFQDFQIYAVTIAENVLMRAIEDDADEELVVRSLEFSGLWDKVQTLSYGFHTIVTKEFDEEGIYLSGGEYQKLAMARAYARECDILIFDEPSSALDPIAEYEMFQKLIALGHEKTVFFISHRLSSTIHADMILLLEDGKIKEAGKHDELIMEKGRYYNMFTLQAERFVQCNEYV